MKSKTKLEELPVEIIDGDRGENYPTQNEFLSSGYCLFLSTRNVPDMKFDFSECQFIDKKKDELLRSGKLKRGDIVFTTRGTVGNLAIFDDGVPYEEIRINSGMVILRCLDGIDNYFFYSYLQNPNFKKQIKNFSSGSAQPQLPIRDMKSLIFSIPEKAIQVRIGNFIHVLDNKIENLQKQNQILEQIIQSIFKSWFIDFDGQTEFEDSELGQIPKGWKVKPIRDIIELAYGKSLTEKNRKPGTIPVYGSSGIVGYHNESLSFGPGIIVGRKGNVGSIYWSQMPFYAIDTVYYVKTDLPLHYVFQNFQNQNFMNSDSSVPGLQRDQAYSLPFLIPADSILEKFENIASQFRFLFELTRQQIYCLTNLRDSLLPKLMSGEIRV